VDVKTVEGDLLKQPVEVIVNAWNRNIIPWWLLLPQGVSGAIKRQAGYQPFLELGKMGPIPLGNAVYTSAGRLPYKGIIHVAGINMFWQATSTSIDDSVRSAIKLAEMHKIASLAFPIIGAGSGSFAPVAAEQIMVSAFTSLRSLIEVTVVRYRKS